LPRLSGNFLDPAHRLSAAEEQARYRHHRNDPADIKCRRFLSKLAEPLLQRLVPPKKGLDYGCGPGSALACMLREAGHSIRLFDPLFSPDPEPLADLYDFITCTETSEDNYATAMDRNLPAPGPCMHSP